MSPGSVSKHNVTGSTAQNLLESSVPAFSPSLSSPGDEANMSGANPELRERLEKQLQRLAKHTADQPLDLGTELSTAELQEKPALSDCNNLVPSPAAESTTSPSDSSGGDESTTEDEDEPVEYMMLGLTPRLSAHEASKMMRKLKRYERERLRLRRQIKHLRSQVPQGSQKKNHRCPAKALGSNITYSRCTPRLKIARGLVADAVCTRIARVLSASGVALLLAVYIHFQFGGWAGVADGSGIQHHDHGNSPELLNYVEDRIQHLTSLLDQFSSFRDCAAIEQTLPPLLSKQSLGHVGSGEEVPSTIAEPWDEAKETGGHTDAIVGDGFGMDELDVNDDAFVEEIGLDESEYDGGAARFEHEETGLEDGQTLDEDSTKEHNDEIEFSLFEQRGETP